MSISSLPTISLRTGVALTGAVGALFAPWWVPVICMVFLAFRYPAWEVPALGLLIDLMWLPGEGFSVPLFTIGAIAIVWLFAPLRSQFLTP